MHIRTIVALAIVPAVALVSGAGFATADPPVHATRAHIVTFTEVNHPDTDVDLDLGPAGLSLGDEQLFHAGLDRDGQHVGDVYGVGTVVQASDSGLSSQVVSTAVLPDGTFTLQLLFQMSFADGPPATRRGAVTGGTGTYRGVTGECVSNVIPGSDNNRITCRFVGP